MWGARGAVRNSGGRCGSGGPEARGARRSSILPIKMESGGREADARGCGGLVPSPPRPKRNGRTPDWTCRCAGTRDPGCANPLQAAEEATGTGQGPGSFLICRAWSPRPLPRPPAAPLQQSSSLSCSRHRGALLSAGLGEAAECSCVDWL